MLCVALVISAKHTLYPLFYFVALDAVADLAELCWLVHYCIFV